MRSGPPGAGGDSGPGRERRQPTGATGHTDRAAEERLGGGFVAEVVRVGDTVRRTPPENADFVAALLRHLERTGADVAPRHLGTDERDRQVLSHVDGRVPWRDREDPAYFADPALTRLAELLRRLHDACAGSPLAGDAETVCHRDLSPKNTVYRDSPAGPLPVALIAGTWPRPAGGSRTSPSPPGTGRRWGRTPTRRSWAGAPGCSATPTRRPARSRSRCPAPNWST
ncbi:phosphotransferase [Micromonospora sp. NPDC023644]|uniref:phosphotransferase n=1 Tax=Micromonospora sp. NPDC023644 TaxID=3154321 RepID=UPI0033CCE311